MLRYTGKAAGVKIFNDKVGVFLLILAGFAWSYDQPYLNFIKENNVSISWCIFPFFMSSYLFLFFFYIGIVYVNSDVPFMQHINMYQVIRTGRIKWGVGQICGIFIRSFLLTVLTAIIVVFPFVGHVEFTADWGKVIYTLARDRNINITDSVSYGFNYDILNRFTPVQLMLILIALCTLICFFLGMLMFFLSLYAGRIVAVTGAIACAFMVYFVENILPEYKQALARVVPTYWAEFAKSATPVGGYYRLPSLRYMFSLLIVINLILTVLICAKIKIMEFNWENEDM